MIPAYGETLLKDARLWTGAVRGREVETVFFGGGTPSLTPAPEMRTILDGLRETFGFAADAEISLEANPGLTSLISPIFAVPATSSRNTTFTRCS